MEITWTVEHFLFITDDEMKDMVNKAHIFMRYFDREEAIKKTVYNYLSGQNDSIFYNITEEARAQIEKALDKILTE